MQPQQPIAPGQPTPVRPNPFTTAPVAPAPVAPVAPEPVAPEQPVSILDTDGDDKKKSLIIMIVLGVLALGGIVFGIIGMVTGANKKPETVVKVEKTIDLNEVQNLVNPFLKPMTYLGTILDFGFSDSAKFELARVNSDASRAEGNGIIVDYQPVSREYEYLFGEVLEKKSYGGEQLPIYNFVIDEATGTERFVASEIGGSGGYGIGTFSIVKDAYYDGEDLIVEIYHDNVTMCAVAEGEDTDYCLPGDAGGATYKYMTEEMADFIDENEASIPVYSLFFSVDEGHYVLTDIEQDSVEE